MEDPYTRINTGRAVMNRDKFDKILTAFSHAQKKLPACILQCKDCLTDRCEVPIHEPTFHDPIDNLTGPAESGGHLPQQPPYRIRIKTLCSIESRPNRKIFYY